MSHKSASEASELPFPDDYLSSGPSDVAEDLTEHAKPPSKLRITVIRWAPRIFTIIVLAIIIALLVHLLTDINPREILHSIEKTPHKIFAAAVLFSGISYLALMGYDACAIHTVSNRPVRASSIAIGSFCSYAVGQTLGFPLVTAGAVRWRIYGKAGLNLSTVAKLTIIANLTLWMGMFVVLGTALVFYPRMMSDLNHLSLEVNKGIGVTLLLALAGFVGWCGSGERYLGRGVATLPLPNARTVIVQIILGFIDVGAAAAALWIFLPPEANISFMAFAAIFSAAIILAIVSHLPAGLGAFEAIVLLALPHVPAEKTISALLMWRIAYTLIPFICAVGLFALYEVVTADNKIGRGLRSFRRALFPFIPPIVGVLTFLGGVVLLVSGAVPSYNSRIAILTHFVPLPFSEVSHLIGSVSGVALLVLSHGLIKRLETAWFFTVFVLIAGIVVSLLKGLDWEEATILTIILVLLLSFRDAFYRKGALLSAPPSKGMIALILLFIAGSTWLGFLAYTDIAYQKQLWWDFTWHDDVSRFLRSTAAIFIVCAAAVFYVLIGRRPTRKGPEETIPYEQLKSILAHANRADANLALLGDKRFLFHPEGDAFLMYRVQGKSWIVMGDPVGPKERITELMWTFMDEADKHAGWPVFYQVSTEHIPLYLDGGFSLVKLGEEARVDISKFSIEGKSGKDWRFALNRMQKTNLIFEIVPANRVLEIRDQLREVSDIWLSKRGAAEKGFSTGFWDDDYILNFDTAIIKREDKIIAFANLWQSIPRKELTVDLMRHLPDEPGVMDLLFLQIILYGKEHGLHWFNLGMAPLSGLSPHRLAPSWHKIASFVAKNSERFYGFSGLRRYKSKFKPQWEPRYLAYPGGWMLPQILIDVTALISGGVSRTLWKK
ncbi:bifunctional lysylphosphatidylglycerol flippase/synthetase MprF [Microvirga sp. W0021]|uniref:Bifunctional lysylphosphatidylglycerol flippase/synthetase MprF n=1 Tax=Hohaiivirga grylli TaxID=3133970 RepID=A0ABV0BJC1_9HYPH